jgi:RNA polymerase sigma-70 factor (ECF subfamily)
MPESDIALLRRWQTGDGRAAAELSCRHRRFLYGFLRGKIASHDIDDVVQEALLSCLVNAHNYREDISFRGFLLVIVRRTIRADRRRASRLAFAITSLPLVFETGAQAPSTTSLSDFGISLHEAMQQLSPELRSVIVLSYWHDLTQAEIAKAIGLPRGTVASRLRRAQDALRCLMMSSTSECDSRGGGPL